MEKIRKRSNVTKFIVIFILVGVSALVGWRIFNRPRPSEAVSIAAIRARHGVPVTTWNVVTSPWEFWLPLYGTVRTAGLSEVYASQAERVQAATARHRELSMRYERTKELEKAGGSSMQEVESLYSQFRDAGASLQQLRTELSRHRVVSPIDGVVMQRNAELGLLASPGRPLFVIGDPKLFEIVIELSPRHVNMVRAGEKARFLSGGVWEDATVKRVNPMADARTGLYTVVLDVQSTRLHIGASVEAQIRIEHDDNVVAIPYESVRETGDVAKVYVHLGDTAVERVVVKGRTDERGRTRILSGLASGEVIVLKGADRMYDGAKIWPQES